MPDTTPRPCRHTGFAILAVLLAGLLLGAFSPAGPPDHAAANAVRMMAPAER